MNEQFVNVETIAEGAVLALGNEELEKVLQNIGDPNTDPEAVREITIRIAIKPDDSRELAAVQVQAKCKLAPHKPAGTAIYLGKKGGRVVAVDSNPRQAGIFDTPEEREQRASVQPINR